MAKRKVAHPLADSARALVNRLEDTGMLVRYDRPATPGFKGTCPAVFLFFSADAWCWIEPSYLDPWGAGSPALHRRTGLPNVDGDRLRWTDGQEIITVEAFDPANPATRDDGASIVWWQAQVPDVAAERLNVLEMIQGD